MQFLHRLRHPDLTIFSSPSPVRIVLKKTQFNTLGENKIKYLRIYINFIHSRT